MLAGILTTYVMFHSSAIEGWLVSRQINQIKDLITFLLQYVPHQYPFHLDMSYCQSKLSSNEVQQYEQPLILMAYLILNIENNDIDYIYFYAMIIY